MEPKQKEYPAVDVTGDRSTVQCCKDEMAGWHHWLNAHEFGWTPGVGDEQGGDSWGCKELDMTEWLHFLSLFMDLTFQVQMQYCSLQHWTLLPSPITSTTGCCFCFGSISLFFLELFLQWSPGAYWPPTDLGSSSFSVLSVCLFIVFMGFSRQEYWSGLPFPSPVDHVLSELSTMTHPSWVALQGMAHSFIELDKLWSMWSDWLVVCDCGFCLSAL